MQVNNNNPIFSILILKPKINRSIKHYKSMMRGLCLVAPHFDQKSGQLQSKHLDHAQIWIQR